MPFQQVAATINKGVFNPVVYRPLFECLGMVTCRTFETPAAGTIPLFLLERDYVAEIFGERAAELVLDGEQVHDKIADVLARPEHYAEIVMAIREDFRHRHSPEARLRELVSLHRGMTNRAQRQPELHGSAPPQRMKLRYGFNEIDGWAAFALGDHREKIRRRLQLMGTQVIRVFVFDKPVPDPVKEWHWFAAVLQAVLDAGAKPMITFAKFHPPFDKPASIRDFSSRCCEIVWGCLEQWGGDEVKDWYWCVWNEPNNPDIGGDVSYAQYRRIYETTAARCHRSSGAASRRAQGQIRRTRRSTGLNERSGWIGLRRWLPTSMTACSDSSTGTCMPIGARRCRARRPTPSCGVRRTHLTAQCSKTSRWRRHRNTKLVRGALVDCCTAAIS